MSQNLLSGLLQMSGNSGNSGRAPKKSKKQKARRKGGLPCITSDKGRCRKVRGNEEGTNKCALDKKTDRCRKSKKAGCRKREVRFTTNKGDNIMRNICSREPGEKNDYENCIPMAGGVPAPPFPGTCKSNMGETGKMNRRRMIGCKVHTSDKGFKRCRQTTGFEKYKSESSEHDIKSWNKLSARERLKYVTLEKGCRVKEGKDKKLRCVFRRPKEKLADGDDNPAYELRYAERPEQNRDNRGIENERFVSRRQRACRLRFQKASIKSRYLGEDGESEDMHDFLTKLSVTIGYDDREDGTHYFQRQFWNQFTNDAERMRESGLTENTHGKWKSKANETEGEFIPLTKRDLRGAFISSFMKLPEVFSSPPSTPPSEESSSEESLAEEGGEGELPGATLLSGGLQSLADLPALELPDPQQLPLAITLDPVHGKFIYERNANIGKEAINNLYANITDSRISDLAKMKREKENFTIYTLRKPNTSRGKWVAFVIVRNLDEETNEIQIMYAGANVPKEKREGISNGDRLSYLVRRAVFDASLGRGDTTVFLEPVLHAKKTVPVELYRFWKELSFFRNGKIFKKSNDTKKYYYGKVKLGRNSEIQVTELDVEMDSDKVEEMTLVTETTYRNLMKLHVSDPS